MQTFRKSIFHSPTSSLDPTFHIAHISLHFSVAWSMPPSFLALAGSFCMRQSYNYFIASSLFQCIPVLPTELDSPELKTWLWIM
jgi:hypothetical protein